LKAKGILGALKTVSASIMIFNFSTWVLSVGLSVAKLAEVELIEAELAEAELRQLKAALKA
jgi:hypothetical protein